MHELEGITDSTLPKDRRAFLCVNAQKRLDKFVEFSYIACNQFAEENGLFSKALFGILI
jgi:hypothetical protein